MWCFACLFPTELHGHKLLLNTVFGLAVAGSVFIFGVLIGDWVDRKPRNKGNSLVYGMHNDARNYNLTCSFGLFS